jgi:hypothetical protein
MDVRRREGRREEREDNRCRTAGEGYEQYAYHVHASIGLFPPSNSGSARSIAFRGVGMYIAPCATATSRNASSIMASVPIRKLRAGSGELRIGRARGNFFIRNKN